MTAMMIEAALRALVLAVAVGLGLSLLQVSNVPARKAAWSLVLLASLAMPLLMRWLAAAGLDGMGWTLPSRMAHVVVLVKEAAAPAIAPAAGPARALIAESAPLSAVTRTAVDAAAMRPASLSPNTALTHSSKWPVPARLIPMLYFAVSGALLVRLLWGVAMALRLWMHADRVSPLVTPEPNVRSSARILSPVTIGSGIVLPADYAQWEPGKLRMVMAHERAHVRGFDFYLQLLAGFYTAAFWFSPLGWWLRRTLSTLGEAMSDRAGIEAASSRSDYAQVVVEFAAVPRRALPGVAMACSGNLSRRVESMLDEGFFHRAFAEGRRRAAMALLLLVPAALFATTALIRVPRVSAQTATTAPGMRMSETEPAIVDQAAPELPDVLPGVADAPATAANSPDRLPSAGIAARLAGAAPATRLDWTARILSGSPDQLKRLAVSRLVSGPRVLDLVAQQTDASGDGSGNGSQDVSQNVTAKAANQDQAATHTFSFSPDDDSWALVRGPGTDYSFSGNWNGDRREQIERARRVANGPFLWFTHEGKSYVVDDPAIVARIEAMYKPMEELGRQQEALGKQQEELGRKQEELGKQQEQAGARIPDLSKELASLEATLARLKAEQGQELSQDKLAEMQEKFAEMQSQLGELQGEAGAKQGDFGARMGELGEQQGKLGEQQGRLGEEQGRLGREADRQVRGIIDESIRNRTAKPVQ